jgi:NADH-quinone oxidoreductase subunit G
MADLVNVTIDDIKVSVPAGTLVVDAAKAAGVEIPVFCSHPKLDPLGACRMCLVEFPGPRGSRLDTACTVRVSEGMVVKTDTDQVRAVREATLGFILINHPLDCPICDKGGECPLQDQTYEYGPGASKFVEPKRHKKKHYPISELIMLDQERCILCWRCIRYLEEWEDKPQIGLFERGGETLIDVFPGRPVDAKTSGSIIDICPVGALTNRTARFRYRPWEMRKTPSVCTLCPVGCNLRLDERVHELRRIVARENPAVNDEWICDKGRFLHQYVDHPDRLRTPLIRDNGALRPATWDEALARVVERLEAITEERGANAVGGVASARVSNEAAYLFQKFFRVLVGTNNIDYPDGSAVRAHPTGLSAIADIARSDVVVLAGIDTAELTPVLDLQIKRAVLRKGVKLIVINPRQIELARYANDVRTKGSLYIQVRPGDEAALLGEMADAIQSRKSGSQAGAKPQSVQPGGGPGRGQPAVRSATAAPVTGARTLRPDLAAAVDLLTNAKSPLFIYGPDAARGEQGKLTVTALSNLAVSLGQGDKLAYAGAEANSQGSRDMGLLPDTLPGHLSVSEPGVRDRLGKLWGVQPPAEPGLGYDRMVSGGVHGLWVMGANPAALPANAEALKQLDFLIVQDMFLTETAQLADVVLPVCSFAEANATYTNLERRVQRGPQAVRVEGESRADWAIIAAAGERWLAAPHLTQAEAADAKTPDWKRKKAGRVKTGPAPRPWTYGNVQGVLDEIGKAAPIYANIRWETLGDQGAQWPASSLARPPRRFEPINAPPAPAAQPGSFVLVSGPLLWDAGVLMQHAADQVASLAPAPFVAVNPADLATPGAGSGATGAGEGATVTVTSALGSAKLALRGDPCVMPGAAWVPYGLAGLPAETLGAGRGETVSVTIKTV